MASYLGQVLVLFTLLASALAARHTTHLQHQTASRNHASALHKSLAALLGSNNPAPEKAEKDETSSTSEAPAPAADPSSSSDDKGSVTSIALDSEKQVSALQEGAKDVRSSTDTVYNQLGRVSDEFAHIREDDEQHVHKLLLNVNLRDQLREKLMKAADTLRADDDLLTSQIAAVKAQQGSNATSPALGLISLDASMVSTAGFLAKQASGQNLTAEEDLAKSALNTLETLDQQIAKVRAKDKEEVLALETNAKNRDMLKAVIKRQQDQLLADTSTLEGNLDQIKDLAAPPVAATQSPAVVAAAAVEPAPAEQPAPVPDNSARVSAMEDPSDPGYD